MSDLFIMGIFTFAHTFAHILSTLKVVISPNGELGNTWPTVKKWFSCRGELMEVDVI